MLEVGLNYFFLFFIYSVLGWLVESCFVATIDGKLVNRGFLIGPYCPIYGVGALLIIFYLTQYKENILTVFLLGVVVCSTLEYLTSYIMEKVFKTRWWDYSKNKFNLNGRICGFNSLLFGVASVAVIYFIHPVLGVVLEKINNDFLVVGSILCLVIFVIDTIISFNVAKKFKKTIVSLDKIKRDSTQEFSLLVKETINNNRKFFQARLYKAFPDIDVNKLGELREDIREFLKK